MPVNHDGYIRVKRWWEECEKTAQLPAWGLFNAQSVAQSAQGKTQVISLQLMSKKSGSGLVQSTANTTNSLKIVSNNHILFISIKVGCLQFAHLHLIVFECRWYVFDLFADLYNWSKTSAVIDQKVFSHNDMSPQNAWKNVRSNHKQKSLKILFGEKVKLNQRHYMGILSTDNTYWYYDSIKNK